MRVVKEVVASVDERSIDRGAHPNEKVLSKISQFTEDAENYQISVARISAGDSQAAATAIRSTAQTDMAVWKVFPGTHARAL